MAADGVGFLEGIERGAADVEYVVIELAGAMLGQNPIEQTLRSAGQDFYFEKRIFRFKRAGELAQILAIHRRVPDDAALVLGFAHQRRLSFNRREAIDLGQRFISSGGMNISRIDKKHDRNKKHPYHNLPLAKHGIPPWLEFALNRPVQAKSFSGEPSDGRRLIIDV